MDDIGSKFGWEKVSEEVYYLLPSSMVIGRDDIERVTALAKTTIRGRARLCLHADSKSRVHEMVIVHPKEAYIRPHKHNRKNESFMVIEGHVEFIEFDDQGDITERVNMGDARSGKPFYRRINRGIYHSLLIKSEHLVFFEVTSGPFDSEDTIPASWSPLPGDTVSVTRFMEKIKENRISD